MLSGYELNIMVFLNRNGSDVFDFYYNLSEQAAESFPTDTLEVFIDNHSLQDHTNSTSISGIMNLPDGPCLISAWSVLASNSSGSERKVR